jgi:PAS domain-containing protein
MLKILQRRPISSLSATLLPTFYLAATLMTDHYVPGPPVTPALCTLGLLLMSLLLPTPWMILWALVYTGVIITLFHLPALYDFTSQTRMLPIEITLDIRTFTFFCIGVFSATFSWLLNRHRKSLAELNEIIARFSDPIVVSDLCGCIINCNDKVMEKLGIEKASVLGLSYFDCFAPPELKGAIIAKYLALFDGQTKQVELKLCLGNHHYVGETMLLTASNSTLLLTVFKRPKLNPASVPLTGS